MGRYQAPMDWCYVLFEGRPFGPKLYRDRIVKLSKSSGVLSM